MCVAHESHVDPPPGQGLSDAMLAASPTTKEAFQVAHDALSDAGACLRSLPSGGMPADNNAVFNLLEILVDKIRFMRYVVFVMHLRS